MSRALVLNATYEPLCVVPTRRALLLVLQSKAELLSGTGRVYHSARISLAEPSVVRLAYYVRVPHQAHVALNRRAIFARDGHRCQYCGAQAENIDHIVPRSKGGLHCWENVVAACRRCNARKRDHMLEESGMKLRRPPTVPRGRQWALAALGTVQPDWEPYLGDFGPSTPDELDGVHGLQGVGVSRVNGLNGVNGGPGRTSRTVPASALSA